MGLDDEFFVTAGSVVGREHVRLHKNNQDGVALSMAPDLIVAAVTDGCSSGKHSEVGARLAATWLARWVPAFARGEPRDLANEVSRELVGWIGAMLGRLAPPPRDAGALVSQFFLFTYLVAVIRPDRTLVFGEGDGVVSVNGDARVLDPGPDNAPRYPAYACVPGEGLDATARAAGPSLYHDGPTGDLRTLAIGTDGVADLIAGAGEPLPDGQLPGGLEQFETQDRFVRNPCLVHKRLVVLGDGHARLRDDTTLALVRRREVAP